MTINSISYNPTHSPFTQGLSVFGLINRITPNTRDHALAEKVTQAEQLREIQSLKDRDREVKIHEQAHLNAAGGIAISDPHFSYTTGPDGQRYAVGGDVSIDASAVPGDPQATLRKAEAIRRAALAPAQPSSQDYSVASEAAAMASKAVMELFSRQNQNRLGSQLDIQA